MNIRQKNGFTLIEVIVSALIILISGTAIITGISVLTRSFEVTDNRSMATNLLQQSQEEVRRVARTFFNTLDNCQFPQPGDTPGTNPCGFHDTDIIFPRFTRQMTVSNEFNSLELKRIVVDVNYQEIGQTETLSSVILLARPPDPLPGNIIGFVHPQNDSSTPISGASITVARQNSTEIRTTTSTLTQGVLNENFDFKDSTTGAFVLAADSWDLTVQHSAHEPFTYSLNPVVIGSGQQVFIDISLVPLPVDGFIEGDVVDLNSGGRLPNFSRGRVRLYDDGGNSQTVNDQSSFSFTISFQNSNQQCFTLVTENAFKVGYSYNTSPGGISPSCPFLYNREGYSSSSVVDSVGTLNCTNPYRGDISTDRVCVDPGQTVTFNASAGGPVAVEPAPEVLITGNVVDDQGTPLANARIHALWPRSDSADWRKLGTLQVAFTDAAGNFSYSVPAVQGMFVNSNPFQNYLRVRAEADVPILNCCDVVQTLERSSPTIEVGPLFPNDPARNVGTFVIPTTPIACGNADGVITDDNVSAGISGANVRIYSTNEATNGTGFYIFDCPTTGFRLPTGTSRFRVSHGNYYNYDTNGNLQYSSASRININTNQVTTYNAKMWPTGFGDIDGTVRDAGTGNPIAGANIKLTPYTGSALNTITDGSGQYNFNNVIETWPAVGVPSNDPYYRQNNRLHSLEVTHSSGIYQTFNLTTPALIKNTTLTIDVDLISQGGL